MRSKKAKEIIDATPPNVKEEVRLYGNLKASMNRFQQALEERIRMASSPVTESAYIIVKNLYERFHVEPLKEFYNWYLGKNEATRAQVLNHLQKVLGLEVVKYPEEEQNKQLLLEEFIKMADIRTLLLYHPDKDMIKDACLHFLGDEAQAWFASKQKNPEQGKLNLKHKPPKGELDL